MTILKAMLQEFLGLFMEDELLAVGILLVVGAVAVLIKTLSITTLSGGAALVIGCVGVLAVGVWRTTHACSRSPHRSESSDC